MVVERDQNADEKHHADVENQEPPEDLTDSTRHGSSRIGCLAGGDTHHFCASVERSGDDEGPGNAIDGIGEGTGCDAFVIDGRCIGNVIYVR